MSIRYRAAENDDPFAMYVLVGLEEALQKVHRRLLERHETVSNALSQLDDQITIDTPSAKEPEVLNVNVSHYGFKLLDLIVRFDKLCRDTLSAMHRSRIPPKDGTKLIEKSAEDIRGLLSSGMYYRFTGVDREDLRQRNQRAQGVVDKLIETRFINAQHFGGFDDIADFFAGYDKEAEFGPTVKPRAASGETSDSEVATVGPPQDEPETTPDDTPTNKPKITTKKRATKKKPKTGATISKDTQEPKTDE